jgi:hypothetical protein
VEREEENQRQINKKKGSGWLLGMVGVIVLNVPTTPAWVHTKKKTEANLGGRALQYGFALGMHGAPSRRWWRHLGLVDRAGGNMVLLTAPKICPTHQKQTNRHFKHGKVEENCRRQGPPPSPPAHSSARLCMCVTLSVSVRQCVCGCACVVVQWSACPAAEHLRRTPRGWPARRPNVRR